MSLLLKVFSVLLKRINIAIKTRVKVIRLRHNKKICNHCKRHSINKLSKSKSPNNRIRNFLSCLQKRRFKLYCMVEINIFHQIQIDDKSTQTLKIFIKIF